MEPLDDVDSGQRAGPSSPRSGFVQRGETPGTAASPQTSSAAFGTGRVGLVRHFRVQVPMPRGWYTARQLQEWREKYDRGACTPCQAALGGVQWDTCLSSDTPRAMVTARALFSGNIETTRLLREAEFAPFRTGKLSLPVFAWHWMLRLAWMTGHSSQRQCRDEFKQRVLAVADELEGRGGDVLVVSHAGFLAYLSAELRRRNFNGPKLRIPENARLYLYQRRELSSLSKPAIVVFMSVLPLLTSIPAASARKP